MPVTNKRVLRCAIYTRKSSEEGLEQSFNSLDAQREACAAYIESQRHEGWRALSTRYDDGGFSGGSIDRPALTALLSDIDAGNVDLVVVYKVDRLTRSLTDFAKMVELFDAKGVSFVSVTQAFNTTTSMGRLTLNVLLSFAQFEREVTGERIRDKIAASKRRGMWMGGSVPFGYDRVDRKLVLNPAEAELVRKIYRRYVTLKNVLELQAELNREGIRSKRRTNAAGRVTGGVTFSRGALYLLLRNRIYLGEIVHRGESYPGEHKAIVPQELWDQVQERLRANGLAKRLGTYAKEPSLLAGIIYDEQGQRLTPTHTVRRNRRLRYYVTQAVLLPRSGAAGVRRRIPAYDLEDVVSGQIRKLLAGGHAICDALNAAGLEAQVQKTLVTEAKRLSAHWPKASPPVVRRFLLATVLRITVGEDSIEIELSRAGLMGALLGQAGVLKSSGGKKPVEDSIALTAAIRLGRTGNELRLVLDAPSSEGPRGEPSLALLKAIARARSWYEKLTTGAVDSLHTIAKQTGLDERYVH